jgi:hypothetical protein
VSHYNGLWAHNRLSRVNAVINTHVHLRCWLV